MTTPPSTMTREQGLREASAAEILAALSDGDPARQWAVLSAKTPENLLGPLTWSPVRMRFERHGVGRMVCAYAYERCEPIDPKARWFWLSPTAEGSAPDVRAALVAMDATLCDYRLVGSAFSHWDPLPMRTWGLASSADTR